MPGAPHILAKALASSIINGGDGAHEHPTQALLDLFTIREKKGTLDGLKVAIVGDIAHSRVARSNIFAMKKFDIDVTCCAPPTMIPPYLEDLGVNVEYRLDKAVADRDVIMMLRIQKERGGVSFIPSIKEYAMLYSLKEEHLQKAKKDVIIMHPGPMNRGVEISDAVADGPYSVILDQVENGVAVRMGILFLLLGGES
jgi:aspartate carbamoyltransferase catalytic subunit